MDWLKPFMHKRAHKKGEILFKKGDHAEEMFYILSGSCRVQELNLTVSAGQMLGELGFLSPDNTRTGTVECLEDVELGTITYDCRTSRAWNARWRHAASQRRPDHHEPEADVLPVSSHIYYIMYGTCSRASRSRPGAWQFTRS